MKVIDIDKILEIIDSKFDEVIYKTLNKNNAGWRDVCMFPNTRELFNLKIRIINELNTLKIIEEDKPIEKLKIAFLDNYEPNEIDRKCWNRLNEHQDKINEIIDEINKLKKESDK